MNSSLFLRLTALILCIVLLTGCAGNGGTTPRTDAPAPETPAPTDARPAAEAPFPEAAAPAGAVGVHMTRDDGEGEKVRFEGQDSNGAVVWQRTETTQYRTELTLIEEIGTWEDRYYYTREGNVCCLRLSDGTLLWENGAFGGSSISGLIDPRNGNVYLCGWYGPDFFACDKNGKTLCKYDSAGDFYWPSDMSWRDPDNLVIYWSGGAGLEMALPYYIDLKVFSLSYDHRFQAMDANRQYWANIFISDFIEQFKNNYPTDGGSDYELSRFAQLFCKINKRGALSSDGNYDTFSLDTVNELCMRFFGREIHPVNGVLYENQGGLRWTYEDGKFHFPTGDGEAYNRFAVVNSYLQLEGGDVILGYDVYELNLEEYWKSGMDGALYRMTPAQAQTAEVSGRVTRRGYGYAEATPIEQNGHDGYCLLRMETTMY
ncbi:MAG: hypothetical protein IJV40_05755 [Oscillospiraceae bacterium]|nr:hypothetical protein [Oscillospiraceae bacterium]